MKKKSDSKVSFIALLSYQRLFVSRLPFSGQRIYLVFQNHADDAKVLSAFCVRTGPGCSETCQQRSLGGPIYVSSSIRSLRRSPSRSLMLLHSITMSTHKPRCLAQREDRRVHATEVRRYAADTIHPCSASPDSLDKSQQQYRPG